MRHVVGIALALVAGVLFGGLVEDLAPQPVDDDVLGVSAVLGWIGFGWVFLRREPLLPTVLARGFLCWALLLFAMVPVNVILAGKVVQRIDAQGELEPPQTPLGGSLATGMAVLGAGCYGLFAWSRSYERRQQRPVADAAAPQACSLSAEQVRAELAELGLHQGVAQIRELERKFQNLKHLLGRKLEVGELTYGRYLGVAEQVYLCALDNLHEAALGMRAVHTIELAPLDKRLAELRSRAGPAAESNAEIESLLERRALYTEHEARAAERIGQNEAALTQIDRTAVAIARMETQPDLAQVDLDTALGELEQLAARAPQYSRRS